MPFLPTVDLPPTGTDRVEYYMQQSGAQTLHEEEFLFNTKDYIHFDLQNTNIVVQEYLRNLGRRLDRLMVMLRTQLENKQPSFFKDTSKKELQEMAGLVSVFVLLTNPEKIALEITPEATVFFTAVYQDRNAYLEIHASPEEDTELVFNIYHDGAPVFAYGGSVEAALNKYIQFFLAS